MILSARIAIARDKLVTHQMSIDFMYTCGQTWTDRTLIWPRTVLTVRSVKRISNKVHSIVSGIPEMLCQVGRESKTT